MPAAAPVRECVLVLNAGSSSLKFCVFARPGTGPWRPEARGQVESVDAALDALADWLGSNDGMRVLGVGHRVVHGGPRHGGPAVVTPELLAELRELAPLAPLHQPQNLAAIEAVAERLPGVPQVACFDTSFHRGQPAVAQVVPLPREVCSKGV